MIKIWITIAVEVHLDLCPCQLGCVRVCMSVPFPASTFRHKLDLSYLQTSSHYVHDAILVPCKFHCRAFVHLIIPPHHITANWFLRMKAQLAWVLVSYLIFGLDKLTKMWRHPLWILTWSEVLAQHDSFFLLFIICQIFILQTVSSRTSTIIRCSVLTALTYHWPTFA